MNLLERYQAGDCEAVWSELVSDEGKIPKDVIQKVADETVDRARTNFRLLHGRLLSIGYEFARPDLAFAEADDESRKWVDKIERELGTLPVLVRTWYLNIKSVDFSQSEKQCAIDSGDPLEGMGWYPYFVYFPLEECLANSKKADAEYEEWYQESVEFMDGEGYEMTSPSERNPFLPLGGFASTCEAKGFQLPAPGADGEFFDEEDGPIYFNEDARGGFEYGGFPRLTPEIRKLIFPKPKHPDPDGLLAMLANGLLPV